jgi:hypothetical protein
LICHLLQCKLFSICLRFICFDRSLNWVHIGGVVARSMWGSFDFHAHTAPAAHTVSVHVTVTVHVTATVHVN